MLLRELDLARSRFSQYLRAKLLLSELSFRMRVHFIHVNRKIYVHKWMNRLRQLSGFVHENRCLSFVLYIAWYFIEYRYHLRMRVLGHSLKWALRSCIITSIRPIREKAYIRRFDQKERIFQLIFFAPFNVEKLQLAYQNRDSSISS